MSGQKRDPMLALSPTPDIVNPDDGQKNAPHQAGQVQGRKRPDRAVANMHPTRRENCDQCHSARGLRSGPGEFENPAGVRAAGPWRFCSYSASSAC
jgi:hypothetical protein